MFERATPKTKKKKKKNLRGMGEGTGTSGVLVKANRKKTLIFMKRSEEQILFPLIKKNAFLFSFT